MILPHKATSVRPFFESKESLVFQRGQARRARTKCLTTNISIRQQLTGSVVPNL